MKGEQEPVPNSTPAGTAQQPQKTAVICGVVKYPWGIVKKATVKAGPKIVQSDDKGEYKISELAPGRHTIAAEAPFPGYEATPIEVEVVAGEIKVVEIYLDFKKTIVEGAVCDLNGKPIAGALLSGVLSGADTETAKTDEQGHFRFDRVSPGDRFIRVNAPGYAGDTRDFTAKENEATKLEFRLTPASYKISGNITDEEGRPLQVELILMKMGIAVGKTTSDPKTGYYEFPVLEGIHEVIAQAPMRIAKSWRGSVSSDIRADLRLAAIRETHEQEPNQG